MLHDFRRWLERPLRQRARRVPVLVRLHGRLSGRPQQLGLEAAELRLRLAEKVAGRSLAEGMAPQGGLRPENMVWIFGSGRSGSTWLRSMMSGMSHHVAWEEPMVGRLFGEFYDRSLKTNLQSADFIMGEPIRRGWIRSIREFILSGAHYSHPRVGPENFLVIKEPNGSAGAPLIMEALPESRMILLVRDPRDVVASVLDASRRGGWLDARRAESGRDRRGLADRRPSAFVRQRAKLYRQSVGNARRAYEDHRGPKTQIRYEDLVADTAATMTRAYAELGIPFDKAELARTIEEHSWSNVPAEDKGKGKFYRKGTAGGWREDLAPQHARIVEEVTGPLLREFYPGS